MSKSNNNKAVQNAPFNLEFRAPQDIFTHKFDFTIQISSFRQSTNIFVKQDKNMRFMKNEVQNNNN